VSRPLLMALAFSLLALLFGMETRQALLGAPVGADNASTASVKSWQPGAPVPDPAPPADPAPVVAAVAARPLFRPDRQPFREQAASPAASRNYDSELSRFMLLGVFGFGEEPVGVVTGKTGNKTERWELKVGDALPGFTVKEVGMEGLRLTSDGREFLLPLYAGAPTAAGGALRTEVPRHDATPSSAAPGPSAPAKPAVSGARPGPAALPATAQEPERPQTPTVSMPYRPPPGVAPRFGPGRR
jgi:hypothetical protein